MLMKRSETNVCFGLLAICCQNNLKEMTKYGIIKQIEKVKLDANILLGTYAK